MSVSEELNSVETFSTNTGIIEVFFMFQKNLIVWKRTRCRLSVSYIVNVSEGLNSVETFVSIGISNEEM